MKSLPQLAQTYSTFNETMRDIWDEDKFGLYTDWSNARRVATAMGATLLYSGRFHGEKGGIYQFPDGVKCFISTAGNMEAPMKDLGKR